MKLPIGVIEGFYGKTWSWAERQRMVQFLSDNHFNSYWYAPKADKKLRNHWYENWDVETCQQLQELSQICSLQRVQFGIGISPLAIYRDWNHSGREKLLHRLNQIEQISPRGLALLFDDMQGDLPGLADIQCEIAHFVRDNIDVEQLIVCPSYYSYDPVLENLFGRMPENYWFDLGRNLDRSIDLFWTGDKVISTEYPLNGLQQITSLFQRKPVIWDNSIVNDGRKTSPFLNVRAMHTVSKVENSVKALIVNPMNAAALSEIPLMSLTMEGSAQQRLTAAIQHCSPELKDALLNNIKLLNDIGRDSLSSADIQHLDQLFRSSLHPVAQNITRWLDGEYQFDPQCLT